MTNHLVPNAELNQNKRTVKHKMIKKVKQWLGIEGVKLEIKIPEGQSKSNKIINGELHFQSMHTQTVTEIHLVLIERFSRGRGDERLINEYELGTVLIKETFKVEPDEVVIKSFQLPFDVIESVVDQWGNKNMLNEQLAKAARWVRKASSQYRIEVEAKVKGVALSPFDKKEVKFK